MQVAHLGNEAPRTIAVAEPLLCSLMAVGTQNSSNLQLDQLLQVVACLVRNQFPSVAAIE